MRGISIVSCQGSCDCGLKTITYKGTQLWQQLPEKKKELPSELQSLSSENTLNSHFEFAKATLED